MGVMYVLPSKFQSSPQLTEDYILKHFASPPLPLSIVVVDESKPTIMFILIVQAVGIYIVSTLCWRFIRQYMMNRTFSNIRGPPSPSYLTGNMLQIFARDGIEFQKQISEKYGGIIKTKTIFSDIGLYVFDPKALHQIIVKDVDIFEENDHSVYNNRLIFGETLLSSHGSRHRKQRKMLNPAFSVTHMQDMMPIFWKIGSQVRDAFQAKITKGEHEIDVTNWLQRTALELIGQGGLGYSFDSLTEDASPHRYASSVVSLMAAQFSVAILRLILPASISEFGPAWFRRWLVNIIPSKNIHRLRDIVNTMHDVSLEILEMKRNALEQGDEMVVNQVAEGKDIMSILLRTNMEAAEEERLTEIELLGQISSLTFAAMDTTSSALSRILYMLSKHPDAQQKLRSELTEHQKNTGREDFTYEELITLPFLDAVCRETLRLDPPIPLIERVCRKDTVLSLATPLKGVDGSDMTEVAIPNNTKILVSILSSNRNSDIWGSDSYEWKPERWLSPLPETVYNAHIPGVYSHQMTFLGGGRACLGFKFSQLEMKVVLALLVKSFEFSMSEKEIIWLPHGITSPSVAGGDPFKPSLPMNVNLAPTD